MHNDIKGNNNQQIVGNNNTVNENKKVTKQSQMRYSCYWILGFSILVNIISLAFHFLNRSIICSDQSIVLVFIGILATFIVIGNYAQVKNLENEFKKTINDIEKKYEQLYRATNTQINLDFIEKIDEQLHQFTKTPNKDTLSHLFSMIGQIKNIGVQNKYCEQTAQAINQSNIVVNDFEKTILKSLSDLINGNYGEDIPQSLRNAINNIKTK